MDEDDEDNVDLCVDTKAVAICFYSGLLIVFPIFFLHLLKS